MNKEERNVVKENVKGTKRSNNSPFLHWNVSAWHDGHVFSWSKVRVFLKINALLEMQMMRDSKRFI